MNTELSSSWNERAKKVIPGGVSSPVRAFQGVGGTPRYMVTGVGSHVWDVDGNEYIDLIGSWGPMILGHAHPEVIKEVTRVAQDSSSFGAPGPNEVLLAEEILKRVQAADMVRFVSSGTEAVMTAIRIARAKTGKNKIVKFAGCYHGHMDALLVQAGSGVATLGLPNSPGVTPNQTADTLVVEYNNVEELKRVFADHGDDIAAVITESAPANMGAVPPVNNFNKFIREITTKHGSLMLFDEVMTGFRVSEGGWWKKYEQEITPDLFAFGKVIGGGFPLAAVAGTKESMSLLAPEGDVYQAGTLSGNPVATVAGLTTLQQLDQGVYDRLDKTAGLVGNGISEIFTKHGIEHSLQKAGNLFSIFFGVDQVENYADAKAQNTEMFSKFFHSMLEQGVSLPPSAFEAWFVSNAHTEQDIEKILTAAENSVRRML